MAQMDQMSDKIIQTMGIDASTAIAELARLDKSLGLFTDRLNTTAQALQNFNKLGAGVQKLGQTFNSAIPDAVKQTQRLTTSLSLLSRVVFTQAIVRALSQLRNALRETGESAVDFQRRVALIETISDGQSFDSLAGSVRLLSDSFNIPLLEAAEGLYQALSNQVGDLGESLEFTAEAAKFAKATGSSLADSVDLLSGALKSFGLDASDTDKVASTFFKTIDLGRVKAAELGNSFGRVGPLAAEIGLSLEETASAMAAVSVKGSKTSESLTQLRAIITAFQKPSDEMTKALRDLGFTSSESAIRTLQLPGVLNALADSTGGSAEALAKLFPNVRGLSGASSLLSDDLKTLASNIDEMTAAGRNFSNEKFLQATATDAEKVTAEIQKLKNAFTVELGQAVLKTAADLSKFVGGADNVIEVAKAAGPAILGLGGSLLIFRGQVSATNAGLTTLSRSLGLLSLLPVAAGVGNSLGGFLDSKILEARFADLKALEAANAKALEVFKDQQTEARDAANAADESRVQGARKTIQSLNMLYLADVDSAKAASEGLVANTTAALTKILSTREKLVDSLAKAASESEAIVKQSAGRVDQLQQRQGDRDFSTKISGLSDAQRVFALAQRASDLASQARNGLAQGGLLGDPAQVQKALALFDKAQQTGEQAAEIAKRTDNRALEAKAASQLRDITQTQIQAEQRLSGIQKDRQAALDAERSKQQKITDAIREQTKIVAANTGLFDTSGDPLNAADQAKRAATRQAALQKIANLALSQKDLTATGALGVADFVSRFQSELSRDPLRLQFDVERSTAEIKASLDRAFEGFKLKAPVDISALENVLGKTFSSPDQISRGIEEAVQKAAELRAAIDKATASNPAIQGLQGELDKIFQGIEQRTAGRNTFGGAFADGLRSQFAELQTQLATLRNDSSVTEGELTKLIEARNNFGQAAVAGENPLIGKLTFGTGDLQALDAAVVKLQQLSQLQATAAGVPQLEQQLQRLQSVIGTIDPSARFQAAASAIGQGVSPAQQIAAAFQDAATAAERAAAASAMLTTPVHRAFGGPMRYFADGGRGLDTIPAMLSPGEMVVNPQSSQRFFSQLQAINAGHAPVFRQDGGTVNNTSVGDIHLHAAGGTKSARQLATEIRQEIRRGATRPF
jgi:TP901 family phage tail tape measure protein